jgi:hypothetical protein
MSKGAALLLLLLLPGVVFTANATHTVAPLPATSR